MAPIRRRVAPTLITTEEAKPYTAKPRRRQSPSPSPPPSASTSQPHTARLSQIKALLASEACPLHSYTSHPAGDLTFTLRAAGDLTSTELKACVDIVEATSGADYRTSSMGWNAQNKREEMMEREMVYLLVSRRASNDSNDIAPSQPSNNPQSTTPAPSSWPTTPIIALLSFLPTKDDPPSHHRPVLYIYELHLQPSLRRLGLGSALVRFVEACAGVLKISKTMLTVFASNEAARAVYSKLGYQRDRASPPIRVRRTRGGGEKVIPGGYEILSKELGKEDEG